MKQVQCLVCDKFLEMTENELVMDGGFVYIEFHYGSKFDQMKGCPVLTEAGYFPENEKYLRADQIEGYICDDCFEKKRDKLKAYKVEKTTKRIEL